MRFTAAGAAVRDAFTRAYSAAASTATVPVFQCVRVDAGREAVRLVGGNGERTAVIRFPADVSQAGSPIVIPPRFSGVIAACDKDAPVEFDSVAGVLEVRSNSASWRFDLHRELYPDPVVIRPESTVDAIELRSAILRARLGRGKVTGSLASITFRGGHVIAASGSRVVRIPCGGPVEGSISESAAADLSARIKSAGVTELRYGSGPSGMTFTFGPMELLSVRRAPPGPDYEATVLEPVTRARVTCRIEFERAAMQRALASLQALSTSAIVRALVDGSSMRVQTTVGNEAASDVLPLVSADATRPLSFSASAMMDVVSAATSDPVTIRLSDDRPPRLSPLYCTSEGYEAVIPQLRSELSMSRVGAA